MPLDPAVVDLLARSKALGRPPLSAVSPAVARGFIAEDQPRRAKGPSLPEVRDLVLDGAAGPVPVRLYRPADGIVPVLLYVHGGGFVFCDLDSHDGICRTLAAASGWAVVALDYRLAPEHPFPAAADDVVAVLAALRRAAPALGLDAGRIAVGGDSAGGNLAAVTALRLRASGGPALAGQLLVYPVTAHYSHGFASYETYAEGFGLTAADMRWFWDHYGPAGALADDPDAAPLKAADLSGLPPAFVMTAEYDVLRDEGEAYAARLVTAGVPVQFERLGGHHHACFHMVDHPPVRALHGRIGAWLKALPA